jgi:hypothetical protein
VETRGGVFDFASPRSIIAISVTRRSREAAAHRDSNEKTASTPPMDWNTKPTLR